jgi:hypothetical protein
MYPKKDYKRRRKGKNKRYKNKINKKDTVRKT